MTDIHDLKPALMLGPDIWFWFGVWVVVVVLGVGLWRLGQRWGETPDVPLPTPERVRGMSALAQLRRLGRAEWLRPERGREFHSQLSLIVRAVLAVRFGFPAQRLTTSELTDLLEAQATMPAELARVTSVLEACDVVKFAHLSVSGEQMQALLASAIALVSLWGDVAVVDVSRETGVLAGGA